jgi:hypothetical protein
MVSDIQEPQVDGVAAESDVLDGIVDRAGLDDDRSAVLSRSEVVQATSVEEVQDVVRVIALGVGHRLFSSGSLPWAV